MLTLASLAIAAIASAAAPAVPVPMPVPMPAPMPAPMHVPDALLAVTSMPEPSGIVFCPALSRYLVISDDTGDKRLGNNHAPWLFAMDPSGQLDSTPLPILGIEKLNDAEAICKGPAGSYLLATSQSKNRKGQDKSARRMLLQLAPGGRALRVLARLDLITAILASGAIPGESLDIEAMAYRDDALYLGLKSPQTLDGAAIILRIGDFAAALRSGWLDPKKVARWQEVQLRAQGASGEVIQGVSDMSFLPDGSLVLLANSPKRMPPDGGGALYWLRPGTAPQLLRRFPGQKPEGVTLTEDERALMIVIDRDRQQPMWLLHERPDMGKANKKRVQHGLGLDEKVREP